MSHPSAAKETVAGPLSREDRREAERYPCPARGNCQPVTANEAGNCWPVDAVDISTVGVSLLLSRRFEPGTLLTVELSRQSKDPTYLPLARVSRVTPAGPHWLHGCVWQGTVSAEDMQPLIGAAALWHAVRMRNGQALAVSDSVLSRKRPDGAHGRVKS